MNNCLRLEAHLDQRSNTALTIALIGNRNRSQCAYMLEYLQRVSIEIVTALLNNVRPNHAIGMLFPRRIFAYLAASVRLLETTSEHLSVGVTSASTPICVGPSNAEAGRSLKVTEAGLTTSNRREGG